MVVELALVTLTVLGVRGDLDCPSPSSVEQRLAEMLPPDARATNDETVVLSREESAVVVQLRRGDGEILAARRLAPGSCAQLTEAAAVVVAAWHARMGERPLLPGPVGIPSLAPPVVVSAQPRAAGKERFWAVTLAAFASLDRSSTAPATRVGLERQATSGLLLGLAAGWTGMHATPVEEGRGTWWRLALSATAGWRFDVRRGSFFEAGGQVAASLLRVAGSGFAENDRATTFHPGAGPYLRMGQTIGRLSPWLGVELLYWPRPQGLWVDRSSGVADVPPLEALAGGGIQLRL